MRRASSSRSFAAFAALALASLGLVSAGIVVTDSADAAPDPNGPRGPLMMPIAKPAWLGVTMQPSPNGVTASQIAPGSPADRAGMKIGDRLKRVAGAAVSTPNDVQRAVASRAAGDVLPVVIERDGKEIAIRAELAERPSPDAIARATYVDKPAPSLVGLVTVNGPALTTDTLKNRVVILDFWAVWCVPCRMSLPMLSGLQARYGAQGLTVLSITGDPAENAASFARELGLRTAIVLDPEGTTTRAYGVSVLPTTFVIDRRGVVREVNLGYDRSHDAKFEALVKTLLAEPLSNGSSGSSGASTATDAGAPRNDAGSARADGGK